MHGLVMRQKLGMAMPITFYCSHHTSRIQVVCSPTLMHQITSHLGFKMFAFQAFHLTKTHIIIRTVEKTSLFIYNVSIISKKVTNQMLLISTLLTNNIICILFEFRISVYFILTDLFCAWRITCRG